MGKKSRKTALYVEYSGTEVATFKCKNIRGFKKMIKINPKAEQMFLVKCKWCRCFVSYSAAQNSDGICSDCAKATLAAWKQDNTHPLGRVGRAK